MIVMGASLGGTQAVQSLLSQLPASFPQPIAIALHRHRDASLGLVELLQRESLLQVREATDKQRMQSGVVVVAPPDYHLLIDADHLALSIDDPVRYARPSVDVLFESAAAECGNDVIAVVLTGGGVDGAQGAAAVEAAGGTVLVQRPDEAVCGEMPAAAIAATRHAEVVALGSMADRLMQLVK